MLHSMSAKSRDRLYGAEVRIAAEPAAQARKEADRLACDAWNKRMLAFRGSAQPSPLLDDALNAGFAFLEIRCLGYGTNQTVALDIIRRPKTTPIHELERYMRCKACSRLWGVSVQAEHAGSPATDEDLGGTPTGHMVAGRAMSWC